MSDEAQKRIFSKNLRRLLEDSGKTQKELAEAIGESQQVVNTWAIGRPIPRMGRVQKLADFFGVEKSVLVDEWREGEEPQIPQFSNIFPISKKRMPIPGKIACGKPISCNEDRESYIVAGTDVPADFCLKARGDSMTGARIMDGDIVFIRKDAELVNGGIYAVEIDDECAADIANDMICEAGLGEPRYLYEVEDYERALSTEYGVDVYGRVLSILRKQAGVDEA